MPDRAEFLARTLVSRLQTLRRLSAEEGRPEPARNQRLTTIEKVLAVEVGVTDSTTLAAVETAAPHLDSPLSATSRDLAAFAAFLRERLADQLSGP